MRQELLLNGTWKFIEVKSGEIDLKEPCVPAEAGYFEGRFPGSIQGALIDCGKMGSPFFGHGHEDFRWVEDTDWYMVKEFKHSGEEGKRYFLRFEGIDGVGRIYLNGSELGFAQNMFTPYEFDVTELLKEDNRIGIRFYSYVKIARSRDRRGLMSQDFKEGWPLDPDWFCASYIRKGNFACGDDMSQRLMTVGLWRPIKLVAYDRARILNNQIMTRLEGNKAVLTINTEIESLLAALAPLQLTFRVSEEATGKCIGERTLDIAPEAGMNKMPHTLSISHTFQVENPKLWWPNAIGEETFLYVLRADLLMGGSVADSKSEMFGIREIKLVQEPDRAEGGRTFTIEVNGRKVFCKGSNWVPADTLIYPIDDQRYEDLIGSARDANFNMFRINGFGIYESDKFYELCNRYGIMIWQDFMFSDCVYDDENPDFMAETRRECEIVVKMLRNHPCIVLWCGNNEVQWMKWGSGKESRLFEVWGEEIFHELMPEIVERLDPTRPYWPGSPWNEDRDVPNSLTQGNCHLYPWAGLSPVEHLDEETSLPDKWSWENVSWPAYLRNNAKFFCEYGLRGFPDVSTMRSVMPEDRLWPMDRDEYQYHCTWDVPEPHLIDRMKMIIGKEFQDPAAIDSLEEFTLYTQLVQGKTLQIAAELHRSRMYSCSGSIFWQYNDCWPCSTFSIVDYYLRKKAGYYYVKRAFAPVILTFRDWAEKQSVEVWAVNDLGRDVKGKYTLSLKSFEGGVFWQSERELAIPANSAIKCDQVGETITGNHDRGKIFLHAEFAVPGKERIESFHLFEFDREISYPKCEIKVTLDRISSREYMLALETDNYARVISIDAEGELDDNFFDMAPRSMRTVRVKLRSDCCEDPSVSIKTLNT